MSSGKPPARGLMSLITRAKKITEPPFDPTLVENAPKLLDVLRRTDKLQQLLSKTDERGFGLVHLAAEKNQPESLRCLLIKGADPNVCSAKETNEVTPLHVAAGCGHLACLQLLIQAGGNIMAQDHRWLTPIDCANRSGQDICFAYLSEIIAEQEHKKEDVTEKVLMELEKNIAVGNIQSWKHLGQLNEQFPITVNGANELLHDLTQMESMMYRQCILINSYDLVKVLCQLQIVRDIPISLNNASLLHAACRYGRLELVRLLTKKYPSIILSVTDEGYHALHLAVVYKQIYICKVLIQTQLEQNVIRCLPSTQVQASTPLIENECKSVKIPRKFGTTTVSGHSVLHFAVALNLIDILSLLLTYQNELQININANDCGYTALHLAVHLNNCEAVTLLLQKGANANYTSIGPILDDNISRTSIGSTYDDNIHHRSINSTFDNLNISRTPLAEAAVHKSLKNLMILLDFGAEDTNGDVLKVCLPSSSHQEMVVPLLGSLIKCDDSKKQKSQKEHLKRGVINWTNLQLIEIQPFWIFDSLLKCNFLRGQAIEELKIFECITTVNFSNNCLISLPVEVFHLPKMTTLNISNNRLTSLPDLKQVFYMKWPCSALQKLVLDRNSLTQVPEYLFQLPNLSWLSLSHNCISSLPFVMWTSPKLQQLHCSYNELQSIPTNWPQVTETCTVIDTVPLDTPPLIPVQKSWLQNRLNISNANLSIEWEPVEYKEEDKEGLKVINLSNNRIREIPDNLPCLCPMLVQLDLSHNEITEISLPHSFPVAIRHLNLSNNPLTEIDCEISTMKSLPCTNPQVLIEQGNELHVGNVSSCSHRQHTHLMKLGVLELNNCQLISVNFHCSSAVMGKNKVENMDPLKQTITSGSNRKSPVSQSISQLVCPDLTRLILSHNHLSKVPESVCEMVSLNSLDLSHNNITELPASLGNLQNLWELPLNGLKLISPPHNIIEQGKTKDIIKFLSSLLQRARPYHHLKLMLVGKVACGKTTLLQRISEKGQRGIPENPHLTRTVTPQRRKSNLSTIDTVVSYWTYYKSVKTDSKTGLKSITFITWDFGNKSIIYPCFFSRRSLYLAVWNVTHGIFGAEELKPWLLNIQAQAPHSPVIIVGTHIDKVNTQTQRAELDSILQFINNTYGTAGVRKEGFPQIIETVVVSCKTGRGINELRNIIFDVTSQVRENTVAGRGIGCGRIPCLLMDQLVPASFLQLQDTVRMIASTVWEQGKAPVLNYKEFRELVFSDPRTLISKITAEKELEQAVRFLHDSGTLLHYDNSLLSDFYFVDPEWLCNMLSHIFNAWESSPLIKDGIVRTADLPVIFSNTDFTIPYISLFTTFDVCVELGAGELLIPRTLPMEKPPMPCTMFPENLKKLPPLRHMYVVPFIPAGFSPHLMSRILTDPSIIQLAKEGCCICEEDVAQLSWVKWQQGLMLQYGNIIVMSVEGTTGLFSNVKDSDGIKILRENQWELCSRKNNEIFGINVVVPDVYPILKYPEVIKTQRSHHQDHSHSIEESFGESREMSYNSSKESDDCGRLKVEVTDGCANRGTNVHKFNNEPAKKHGHLSHVPSTSHSKPLFLEAMMEQTDGRTKHDHSLQTSSTDRPFTFSHGCGLSADLKPKLKKELPMIDEEKNDIMRAGLMSKAIEHITILIENWFSGVRPRHLVIPCPSCSCTNADGIGVKLERSFSNIPSLVPEAARQISPDSSPGPSDPKPKVSSGSLKPTHSMAHSGSSSSPLPHRVGHGHSPDSSNYYYAFRYDDCVIAAHTSDSISCPRHGTIPLQYLAPDTLCLTHSIIRSHDLIQEDCIGHGAFASIFRVRVKLKGHKEYCSAALKALTKTTKALSRHSILEGFSNLKKEISVHSRLRHGNIVDLLGVTLHPLGLVLELAPKHSLKVQLQRYAEEQMKLQSITIQAVIVQVASAVNYIHLNSIIYGDVKSDNVLVWQFPEPQDSISGGCHLGPESVLVKLCDYGISQVATSCGKKGLVGTPGFMAPEILKYHGREAYTTAVDIFCFGMFIYELLTLRIPYEHFTAQQANQANESGSRPSLTKEDLHYPLLRELMVWCWQEDRKERPTSAKIIETAQTEQFLRLLDGIRVSNEQMTATCIRPCTSSNRFEMWAASSDAQNSKATVLEFNGKFVGMEEIEIEVGDSPVLCMCTANDKIWMGFESGLLVIVDASTKRPYAWQTWVDKHTSIQSIMHLAVLRRIYIALGNGSVLAYEDDISHMVASMIAPARIKLLPACDYHHRNQSSSCLLAVPKITTNAQAQSSFEIWVGQKEGMVTVLDAESLEVVKVFFDLDQSRTLSYVAYLIFADLACNLSPVNETVDQPQVEVPLISKNSSNLCAQELCMSVYGALYQGQYVTRWNAESKTVVDSFNCECYLDMQEEYCISSLYYSNLQLYIGLTCGRILILNAITFSCLCQLSCHRDHIISLVAIELSQLQGQDFSKTDISRNPQTISNGHLLLSFGTGFKSYYDGPESKPYLKSGFLLVWQAKQ